MLTHDEIKAAVAQLASLYPIKTASYFGSYAEKRQTEASDLDLLLEFYNPAVSLLTLSEIKYRFEDLLRTPVDIIHAPIAKDALIDIGKEVRVYG